MTKKVPVAGRQLPMLLLVIMIFLSFVAVGASALTSILLMTILFLQLATGWVLVGFIDSSIVKEPWLRYVLGFAMGLMVTSAVDVIFRSSAIAAFAWLIPALPCSAIFVYQRRRHSHHVDSAVKSHEVILVIGIAWVVLGATYGWQLPFGVAIIALVASWLLSANGDSNRFLMSKQTLSLVGLAVLMFVVGAIRIGNREALWWTMNSDITFTEGASRSIGTWGLGDHIAAVGQLSLSNYHWLPFAWNGLTSRVSGADAWLVTTRITQIIMVVCAVSLIWWLVKHFLKATTWRSVIAVTAGSLVTISVGENFTLMVGTFWLLSIVCYLIHVNSGPLRNNEIPMMFLLTIGLFMIKPQLAVLVVGGLMLLLLLTTLIKFRLDKRWVTLALSSFASGLVVLSLQRALSGSDTTQSAGIRLDLVSVGSFNELGNLRNIVSLPLSVLISGGTLALSLPLFILAKKIKSAIPVVLVSFILQIGAMVVLYSIDAIYSFLAIYMYSAIWISTGLLLAVVMGKTSWFLHKSRSLVVVCGVVIAWAAIVNSIWWRLFNARPSGSVQDVFIRKLSDSPWIPLVLGVVLIWFLWARTARIEKAHAMSTLAALLVIGLVSPISVIGKASGLLFEGVTVDSSETDQFFAFSEELSPLVDIVETSSKHTDIFGSNAFCPYDAQDLCGDPNWWTNFIESDRLANESTRCHGQAHFALDWSLPALTNRRFLIQGPQMFVSCGNIPDWVTERVVLSERFARIGDRRSFQDLCMYGIGWFIADTLVAKRDSWLPYGEIVAETSRLRLLKLDQSLCPNQSN